MHASRRHQLVVVFGCYGGSLALLLPLSLLSGWLTGGVGALPFSLLMLAYAFVGGVTSSSFADGHPLLIFGLAVLLYFTTFSLFAVPTHFTFRGRELAHAIALCLVTFGFATLMAFVAPMHGLPI